MFIEVLFTTAKLCNQPQCPPIDKKIKKMWYKYTMEYYLDIKKNEIFSFAVKWVKWRSLCQVNKQHPEIKYQLFSLTCSI
jgi:hypothetical protein